MNFTLDKSLEILTRTPAVLDVLLDGLSDAWIESDEGEHTWSPYQVLGHLIHGEKTDWMVRIKVVLSEANHQPFEPFDRFAQLTEETRPIEELLEQFKFLRASNLKILSSLNISQEDLVREGIHPEFGRITLRELIAAWAVHDLGHIAQTARVMAKQYKREVGPWINYLGVLHA